MYFSTSSTFFICFLITQHIIGVSCAGNLGTVDYVAIGTSLGIAVFLLIFIAFFLWRAQKNPQGTFGGRAEMGNDNLGMSANKAEQVRIQTISMTPLPQDNGH